MVHLSKSDIRKEYNGFLSSVNSFKYYNHKMCLIQYARVVFDLMYIYVNEQSTERLDEHSLRHW